MQKGFPQRAVGSGTSYLLRHDACLHAHDFIMNDHEDTWVQTAEEKVWRPAPEHVLWRSQEHCLGPVHPSHISLPPEAAVFGLGSVEVALPKQRWLPRI